MSSSKDQVVEERLGLDATPADVFPYFIDPALYVKWQGVRAELDPRPGGHFRVWMDETHVAEGTYLMINPPRLVIFTWGWRGDANVPPGATRVEIRLEADGDGTLLTLRHFGLPDDAAAAMHRSGWVMFGKRLSVVVRGGDPGPLRQ